MKIFSENIVVILALFAILVLDASRSRASAQCQVTMEDGRFYNECNYRVWVNYSASCPTARYNNLSKGPVRPGNYSDPAVGSDKCSYRWSWKAYD